jgi:hypothetical protein
MPKILGITDISGDSNADMKTGRVTKSYSVTWLIDGTPTGSINENGTLNSDKWRWQDKPDHDNPRFLSHNAIEDDNNTAYVNIKNPDFSIPNPNDTDDPNWNRNPILTRLRDFESNQTGTNEWGVKVPYRTQDAFGNNPYTLLNHTEGLPKAFSPCWFDISCVCIGMSVKRKFVPNEPDVYWEVTAKFQTNLVCMEGIFENPLDQPAEISGSFQKTQGETAIGFDDYNRPQWMMTSSLEPLTAQRDFTRIQVVVSKNVAISYFRPILFASMSDHLNPGYTWGLPPGIVKFSNATWTRQWWGTCFPYVRVQATFDIMWETGEIEPVHGNVIRGWGKLIADHGTRQLRPNLHHLVENNPNHPVRFNPLNFEQIRTSNNSGSNQTELLDGRGRITRNINDVARVYYQPYALAHPYSWYSMLRMIDVNPNFMLLSRPELEQPDGWVPPW